MESVRGVIARYRNFRVAMSWLAGHPWRNGRARDREKLLNPSMNISYIFRHCLNFLRSNLTRSKRNAESEKYSFF